MKNITVSVDDELYHSARVAAARRKTNVSALVRGFLTALVEGRPEASGVDALDADGQQRAELVRLFERADLDLGFVPNRSKTYER